MKYALLLPFVVCAGGCGASQGPAAIYIGHVAATSGPDRAVGEQEAWGMRLAVEELTREGLDRVGDRPVHVKHADTRGQEGAVESQAVRMVAVSRAAALYGGNTAEEVLRLERGRVPLLTPLGRRPRESGEWVFSIGATPAAQAHALARFAVVEKGVRSIAIFVDERREEARALADAFDAEWSQALVEKHGKETPAKPVRILFGGDANFKESSQDLAKLQGALFAGTAEDFEEWRKAASKELIVLFGGQDGSLRDGGAFLASAFAIDKDLPQTTAFAQKFREAFKTEPDVHAALAYDGVRILIDAMRRAAVSERLLEELRKTKDFAGLTGPVTFGSHQQLHRPVFIGTVAASVFTPLKRYDPKNP